MHIGRLEQPGWGAGRQRIGFDHGANESNGFLMVRRSGEDPAPVDDGRETVPAENAPL
jgi:hypothetical protein